MKTFTIIGGVNGTGKSSLTGVLRTQLKDLGFIIDVDKITAQGGYTPLEGGKVALKRIKECLDKGVCFTQETTLSGHKTELTASDAKERGYFIRLFYVGLDSPEECLLRIENRVKHGGHNIPEHDVLRRFAGRWEAVAKILPYCDEAHFFDNNNGFVEVAEYLNGELILKGNEHPQWVLELAKYLGKS
jgi:predicted ABC-type ATPase